jgi:hypothetical protein
MKHKHDYKFGHGWSYMKCECGATIEDPKANSEYWTKFFKRYETDAPQLLTGEVRLKLGIRGVIL